MKRLILLLTLPLLIVLLAGCAGKTVRCTSPVDNPQHHYLRGMEALEAGKIDEAQAKFERSIFCNEEFGPTFAGLAIVYAEKAKAQADAGFRTIETERVRENLAKATKNADSAEDRFDYQMARLRTALLLKEKKWLETAQDACGDARELKVDEAKLVYYQGKEAAVYYLGLAYLEALEFQKARNQFEQVLSAKRDGKWHEKADRAWKRVDRIVRAMAGMTVGDVGKKIAVKESVSRGDLAALFVDELKIDKLFAGRIPVASQVAKQQAEFTPADVVDYQFKGEILTLMKWKVRGMEPKYDETTKAYLFKPTEPVSRGELALTLEDVLIKLTGDEKLATAYFGQDKSPFPDVRPTSPYYNAVLNMTTRGIMGGDLSGEFRVNEPVDGADAILAIRVLQQKITIY
jgi:tetratricopeptide (TPR) repeat protein